MKIGIKGSFMIGAICTDGILIATESRGILFDRTGANKTPLAYFDAAKKIFPIDNKCIAETGQGLIGDTFTETIYPAFYATIDENISINDLMSLLFGYCTNIMTSPIFQEFRNQIIIAAGYHEEVPKLYYHNINMTPRNAYISNTGFIESDHTIFADEYNNEMTCSQATQLAVRAIEDYAAQDDRWKTIGGPISILRITTDNIEWLQNEPEETSWSNFNDFVNCYKNGDVDITPIEPFTRQQLDELLGIRHKKK